ncbi:MFS transporter [Nocardioides cavernae]|uniref:MFS transporter n=1 Tax=Nocardioides cavernae TaxID=1921566 RepID=A0ABR8NG35_9ACTN|nr:MFS transporter [Nocardioides cavernae]MBD3926115.1 MFS transporter [Nocardioides cavernae]MBM7513704.1 MFS family permease [Nocardioides cavernae]
MTGARQAGISPGTAAAASAPVPGLSRAVAVLCATEIVSWGVLFYAFPVLASTISADEGWPMVWLVAAFTLALVVSGGCGIWVGRRIDRAGPRTVMTAGSALAVASVVALSAAPSLQWFFAAWMTAGAAMSATLYAPAFAAVTGWSGGDAVRRVRSLTAITLVAGLASTVFAPVTALLLSGLGWRDTYLALAGVLLLTVPLHAWGLRPQWTSTSIPPAARDEGGSWQREGDFDGRAFARLVVAMALAGFAVYAVVINLVPLLTGNGLTTTQAAAALGVGGVGQVVGRLFYGPVLSRLGPTARTVTTIAGVVATTGALAVWQSPFALVCALTFASGTVRGVFTLIQATAVVDRWGVGDIGHRNGILTGAITVVSAFAPWVGALLAAGLGSYDATFTLLAVVAAASMLLLLSERGRRYA